MQRGYIARTGYDVRVRRNVAAGHTDDLYNKDDMQFYIGLKLDGVPTYRNVSEKLPKHGQLKVYGNPEVYEFEEEVMGIPSSWLVVIKVIVGTEVVILFLSCYPVMVATDQCISYTKSVS